MTTRPTINTNSREFQPTHSPNTFHFYDSLGGTSDSSPHLPSLALGHMLNLHIYGNKHLSNVCREIVVWLFFYFFGNCRFLCILEMVV